MPTIKNCWLRWLFTNVTFEQGSDRELIVDSYQNTTLVGSEGQPREIICLICTLNQAETHQCVANEGLLGFAGHRHWLTR